MNITKIKFGISPILILLIVAVVCIQPISAEPCDSAIDTIFTITDKTTVYDTKLLDEKYNPSINYSSLQIPDYITAASNIKKQEGGNLDESEIYDIVCFDNIIPIRLDNVTVPITLYGDEYIVNLNKINIGDINDSIDSYEGTILGLNNSSVVWTIGNNNVFCGFIYYPDNYISITPIQDSEDSKATGKPLHVVYSEHDILQPSKPIKFCGINHQSIATSRSSGAILNNLSQINEATENIVNINLLFVTDNEFYSNDWQVKAQQYIATANQNNCYGRDDIQIHFSVQFDSSNRYLMSNNAYKSIDPLYVAYYYYPDSVLNNWGADICVYLGGNDLPNSGVVGAAGIYGSSSSSHSSVIYTGRHAWIQMVGQDVISNGGDYFRTHSIIHELGHLIGADHQYAYTWTNIFGIDQRTVMHDDYWGMTTNKLEFSSVNYDGDYMHNNALNLRQNKVAVSSYT